MSAKTKRSATKTGGRSATMGVIPGRFALSVGDPQTAPPLRWRWTPLSSLARLETGHTPSRKVSEYWDGEIPWIGIKDATENHGRVIFNTYHHTNELGIENSSARLLPAMTVCLSRTASIGYVVVMGREMATSQDFVNWVCSKKINPHFLKYVLLAEHDTMPRFASGSVHQTIYFPEVKAFHVCLPPRGEQDEIASVLNVLDDKIELNRQMNETLEATARALFKSWFVDFEPVHAKANGQQPAHMDADTAALFPDTFNDDDFPVGWEKKPIDKIAEFLNGLALQKFPAVDADSLPVIKIAELRKGVTEKSSRASFEVPQKYIVEDGDVLFSWSGSLMQRIWTGGRGALNQHLFKVTSEHYPKWFHYLWVDHHLPEFQRIATSKATTMGHIQRHHLTEALAIVPNEDVLKVATNVFSPLFDRCIQNDLEARTLAQLRDTLLPRLMSGEIRVRDAEKKVEAVA